VGGVLLLRLQRGAAAALLIGGALFEFLLNVANRPLPARTSGPGGRVGGVLLLRLVQRSFSILSFRILSDSLGGGLWPFCLVIEGSFSFA